MNKLYGLILDLQKEIKYRSSLLAKRRMQINNKWVKNPIWHSNNEYNKRNQIQELRETLRVRISEYNLSIKTNIEINIENQENKNEITKDIGLALIRNNIKNGNKT